MNLAFFDLFLRGEIAKLLVGPKSLVFTSKIYDLLQVSFALFRLLTPKWTGAIGGTRNAGPLVSSR